MNRLSFEKVFYHIDHLHDFMKKGDNYPVHMIVGLSNACNHQCIWCYADYEIKKRNKSINEISKNVMADKNMIINTLKEAYELGLKSVSLVGTGEPLLHPYAAEIIRKIKKIGLDIGIYTNGVMLKNDIAKAVLECCTFVRISCSASDDKELMELHRAPKGDFELITRNIEALIESRQSLFPTIGVQFASNHINYQSIITAAKHWKDRKVDYFSIKPVYKNPLNLEHGDNKVPMDELMKLIDKVNLLSDENFKVYAKTNQFDTVLVKKQNSRDYTQCYGHSFCSALVPDATLHLCGNLHGRKEFELGNIDTDGGFKAVWKSDKRKKAISLIDLSMCPVGCRMHPLNKILWDLKNPDALIHPKFL